MVFQHFNLFPHLSFLENLILAPNLGLGKIPRKKAIETRNALFRKSKNCRAKHTNIQINLSGGQQQKVAIS